MADDDDMEGFVNADFESAQSPTPSNKFVNESSNSKMEDPISDYILQLYRQSEKSEFATMKYGILAAVPVSIFLFSLIISNSTANLIGFSAFVISLAFIIFSAWLLGQILDNPVGPRAM